jgi:outer membrane protein TolC
MLHGRSTFSAARGGKCRSGRGGCRRRHVEDNRDVLISLAAEVARNYVELRGYQRQAEIARENLALQNDTLELTRSRYQNGFVTELDVARQAAEVATTAADDSAAGISGP